MTKKCTQDRQKERPLIELRLTLLGMRDLLFFQELKIGIWNLKKHEQDTTKQCQSLPFRWEHLQTHLQLSVMNMILFVQGR